MRIRVWVALFCLVLLTALATYAQKKAGTAAKAKTSPNGAVGAEIEKEAATAKAAAAVVAHACLQLYNGPGVLWNIDVTFDPNVYPYHLTGGSIKGTICGSPNVTVTGGTLGSSLKVTATLPSGCATPVNIVGTANVPNGYAGTYGFFGSSTGFSHHTLFLGFNRTSCP